MAFVTFVFFQAFNLLNARHDTRSVFTREVLENHPALIATAAVVLLALIVEMDVLDRLFTLADLEFRPVARVRRNRLQRDRRRHHVR